MDWKIAIYVYKNEVLSIFNHEKNEKEKIILAPYVTKNLIEIVSPTDDEIDEMVYFVSQNLDDGEAYTLSIGKNRNWYIATDDKAALNQLTRINFTKILTTPEIIKKWTENDNVSDSQIKLCLQNIQINGKFRPPKNSLLYTWWNGKVN
ncbi:MAG: hypothetical protein H7A24_11900 [Leptospiraceae bacterium]|nr:hypothetical protein [Leptospiraceae bacterium]MCP5512576.1 hypothetical protein [Leptospiraceae bacterium]